jgi:Dockerin type I domain
VQLITVKPAVSSSYSAINNVRSLLVCPLWIAAFCLAILSYAGPTSAVSAARSSHPNVQQSGGGAAAQDWAQLGTTTLSEREHSGVAYDEATSQLIVFGGDNSVGVLNDTWVFSGTRWNRLQPAQPPPARTNPAVVYDPDTHTIILFGGDTHTAPNGLLNDTWSFDGTTWTQLQTAHAPPARYDASFAYDPVNHEIVLYGGESDLGFLDDTWTFDGTDWIDRSTANDPPARYGAAMASDSVSGGVILFGGLGTPPTGSTSPYLADTWSWKNHQWTQLTPLTSPPGRWDAGLAAGASNGLTLFGGYSDTGLPIGRSSKFSDTWIWNGSSWSQSTASGPGGRYGGAMTADPASHVAVLVGGCCNSVGGFYTDTWAFDGSSWAPKLRNDAPSVRSGAVAVSDSDHREVVLFGGFGGDGFLGDTWINKGGVWLQAQSTTSPAGRFAASIAYDTQHHQTVLFGGQSGPSSGCAPVPDQLNQNHLCSDTWTFDGSSWTRQPAPNSPPFRSLAAMAYDPDTSQTVLYGGYSDQNSLGDTWTWDGLTWTQQSPSSSPPALEGAVMGWDAAHHQLILFGGEGNGPNGPQYFNDTWAWDGSKWEHLQLSTSPPPLHAASMSFDPLIGGLVLSAGQGAGPGTFGTYSDSWLWDGTTWTLLQPTTVPPPRYFASLAYDPTAASLVLFGGGGDDGYLDDTWALRPLVQLSAVVSRKTHGSAGTFDVDLTTGNGIECRSGGAGGNYALVFTFANPLTSVASVSASATGGGPVPGAAGMIDTSDAHRYIVNLSNVPNAQYTTVSLTNVTDSVGNFSSSIQATIGVLLGDVNGDGQVDSSDLIKVKQQTLQPVNDNPGTSNFREDVNTDGSIDSSDLIITKRQTLTGLP